MTASTDHPPSVFAKAKIAKFSFPIIIAGQRFVVLPRAPQNRYAGKNIGRNIAAATLGFMSIDAVAIRPDPLARINRAVSNAGKPRSVSKYLFRAPLLLLPYASSHAPTMTAVPPFEICTHTRLPSLVLQSTAARKG